MSDSAIRCSVTVSLVEEARGGPFVFWHDLPGACARAAELGFDGIEVFAPSADAVDRAELVRLLDRHGLRLAGLGTGGGWVCQHLSLTDADPGVRERARAFVRDIVELGAAFGAPAIVGSMQGRWGGAVSREQALAWLREALDDLGSHAHSRGVPLLFEPLNRYESNLAPTLAAGAELLDPLPGDGVRLLADLFHMNLEESDLPAALRAAGSRVGHVHFADSNRRAVGGGHTDFAPIVAALQDIGYEGYVSAEVFPWPDSDGAAEQTMSAYRRLFDEAPR